MQCAGSIFKDVNVNGAQRVRTKVSSLWLLLRNDDNWEQIHALKIVWFKSVHLDWERLVKAIASNIRKNSTLTIGRSMRFAIQEAY